MRFVFPLIIGVLILRALLYLTVGGQELGPGLAVLIAVLVALAAIDWLLTRHLNAISPLRVYLILTAGALVAGYAVYLFSFLGPASAILLAAGLVLVVLVLTRLRRPQSRRFREAAGLCVECGYDLRASTDRCPECNAPLPESLTRRRRIAAEIRAARANSAAGNDQSPRPQPEFAELTPAPADVTPPAAPPPAG